jgi:hypothetical protein
MANWHCVFSNLSLTVTNFIQNVPLYLINQALCHEDIWGSGGITRPFLASAQDRGEWSASRPCRFTPGENPLHPSDRKLGGPQRRSGHCGEDKILHCPESNPTPARSSTLCRQSYPDSIYIVSLVVINTMLDVNELFAEYPLTSDTISRSLAASSFIAMETSTEHSRHTCIAHCGLFCALNNSILFSLFLL